MSRSAFLNGIMVCLSAVLAQGCNETSFKSGNKKEPGEQTPISKPTQKSIKIPCKDGESKMSTTVSGSVKTSVSIEGEFCGIPGKTAEGNLTAFFILDYSGSMLRNDPIVDGSCGRLKAAQAIVAKLESSINKDVKLSAGLLQFDDKALPPVLPEALNSFKSHLIESKFCENTGGATNYEAAFTAAKDVLKNVEGNKVIYFISDGLPTKAGTGGITSIFTDSTDVHAAGTKAAESLRSEVKDLTLNAIYLGNIDDGLQDLDPDVKPETYLEQITGDKKNVKLAANADALAAEIVKFDTPDVSELDQETIKGEVIAKGFSAKTFDVKNLIKDPTRDGVWTFSTDAIDLFSSSEKPVANEIKISIKGSDGKVYEAVATVTLETAPLETKPAKK